MSTEKKIELISSVKDEYGFAPALRALDLPRATWYYHEKAKIPYEEKYAHVRPILEGVLRDHPSYGIPRITPELSDRYGRRINHKVIQELLHLWDQSTQVIYGQDSYCCKTKSGCHTRWMEPKTIQRWNLSMVISKRY